MDYAHACKQAWEQPHEMSAVRAERRMTYANRHSTPVISATVMPALAAACRLTWSEPMPAVRASLSFFAFSMRSGVLHMYMGCQRLQEYASQA